MVTRESAHCSGFRLTVLYLALGIIELQPEELTLSLSSEAHNQTHHFHKYCGPQSLRLYN